MQIGEPQDRNRVLEDTAPFEKEVMFPAGASTAQLTVPTVNDNTVESDTTVTAVVLPPDPSIEPPMGLESGEYYNAASTPASVLVRNDDTTMVTITAVVGDSGQAEVDEGEEVVFELTHTGDPDSALTVGVEIDEPQDANRVLEDTVPLTPSTLPVVFPVGESTRQLRVPTVNDDAYEPHTAVTAVVSPPDTLLGEPGYYAVGSPGSASVLVRNDDTTMVTITAVGAVGDSSLVEVIEGDQIVFELTHTGDPDSELTVTVAIDEPQDANLVLEDTVSPIQTVVFPAGQSTVQLVENTNADNEFEEHTTVTATVLLAAVAEGEPGHYAVGSPGLASVLVRDDDIPEIRFYTATTQVSITEGEAGVLPIIFEADERPHLRGIEARLFLIAIFYKGASAGDIAVNLMGDPVNEGGLFPFPGAISGSNFKQVEGVWQWSLSVVNFTAGEDEQMEGDETLVLDFTTPSDARIRLVNSFVIAGVAGGRSD